MSRNSITYVFYQIAELASTDRITARLQYDRAIDDVELWQTAQDLGCFAAMCRAAERAQEACYA